jgi:Nif-specific regulatory protein
LRINLPPLRERTEDILPLARLFLKKYCRKYNVEKRLSPETENALVSYHWSGNVRELNQCIERTIFLSTGPEIDAADLGKKGAIKIEFPTEDLSLEKIEKEIILQTLKSTKGNVSKAARNLQIGREALRYRIKKYSISKEIKLS